MRHYLLFGLVSAFLNLLLWLALSFLGSGHLASADSSQTVFSVLLLVWNFVNAPITALLMPELIGYMPSHGGGVKAVFAEFLYVLSCMAWVFAATVFLASLLRLTLNSFREMNQRI